MKGLVVAGTHSGSGKTTVSLALMAALKRRGFQVQAFKVGPDFIDPGHHTQITGRASHNLDGWMLPPIENIEVFNRYVSEAEVVVVEGVMGLYDGYDGLSEAGSTAQMAKWLGLPVLLVADARSMARSLAALALGFFRFDPDLKWVGLAANRVGSPRHTAYLAEAMTRVPELSFRGGLRREPDIGLPERHLGLVTADERTWDREAADRLADWIESGLDVAGLLADLPERPSPQPPACAPMAADPTDRVRIGVARDEAFCFYYQENLRRLEAAGAELVFFSPLRQPGLPAGLDGLYVGGGYPELFARELAGNYDLRRAVREFGLSGRPIYAECGGFMFLCRTIEDLEGRSWPMSGLLPVEIRMLDRLKSLGYRQVTFTVDTPLGPAGTVARGHEFHYSEIAALDPVHAVYRSADRTGEWREAGQGYMQGNVLASYTHLHFGACPELAPNFISACRKGGPRKSG
ncbi:MAG: cobyrinate a,c-diamide synthase [Proteobacteria bacterium]|nr:cobyrinate a,c-diamide synthase [Pseudomonadota bacterium]